MFKTFKRLPDTNQYEVYEFTPLKTFVLIIIFFFYTDLLFKIMNSNFITEAINFSHSIWVFGVILLFLPFAILLSFIGWAGVENIKYIRAGYCMSLILCGYKKLGKIEGNKVFIKK